MTDRLDPATADRLIGGTLDPSDAPPGYAPVVDLLRTLRAGSSREDLAREAETVAAMARALDAQSRVSLEVPDVKARRSRALVPQDAKFAELGPADVKRAGDGDVRTPSAPPMPIRTPAPPATLDRVAWAGAPTGGLRRTLGLAVAGRRGERRRPLRARMAALATALLILGTGGAAAAGVLPAPVQKAVSKTLHMVGIHVPTGEPKESDDRGTGSSDDPAQEPSEQTPAPGSSGATASQHGKEVSRTAHETETGGRQHGEAVSRVARNGHGKGPQDKGSAGQGKSASHRQDGGHAQAHSSGSSGGPGASDSHSAGRGSTGSGHRTSEHGHSSGH
jgi:hypothetical protein